MLSLLDLFTEAAPAWTAEDMIARTGFSRPTGYRYVRELVAAGLLMRLTGGLYHLGPRIIQLDYQIRANDPLLAAGNPIMRQLAELTGCHVLLSYIFDEQVLNVHHEAGIEPLKITFARGVPLPLLRGATSKAILAWLPRARARRIYGRHAKAIARSKLGRNWDEFRRALAAIRHAGYAYTGGELDPPNIGIAAPVYDDGGAVLGSLTFVTLKRRWEILDQKQLVELLQGGARRISSAIAHLGAPGKPATRLERALSSRAASPRPRRRR
jgi:DNA-binding IclR family transcriptional regulator